MTTRTTSDDDQQRFYAFLKKKLKSYRDTKQHLDRFLSTDFNVFKCIEPEENRHSKTIEEGI